MTLLPDDWIHPWSRSSRKRVEDQVDEDRAFVDIGGYRFSSAILTGGDYPEQLSAGRVTAGFFGTVLGVRPVVGRTFLPGDDQPGEQNRIALLGNDFWRTRYGSDPSVVGTTLTLDGESRIVVGVLPPGRPWLDYADVYVPMVQRPDDPRGSFELAAIGRLQPGVTQEAGLADLERVATQLRQAYPEVLAGMGVTIRPSSEWDAEPETRQALWLLLGAVGFLLMIACVNLANLFLARATGRVRETAIRTATGASRGRLIRQGLTESLVVSLLGAVLGLGLAVLGVDAITGLAPAGQVPGLDDVAINGWVLAFTLGAGVLTGVVTGLVPSFQGAGGDAASTLRAGAQNIAGNRLQQRLRSGLVSAEVALSLVLLVGAGLLIRSFGELMGAERGFQTENRLIASLDRPASESPEEEAAFMRQLLDRIEALPPVTSAALVHIRPLASGSTGMGFARPDEPDPEGGIPWASWRLVTPGYFETLGVPLVRGRDFTSDDFTPGGQDAPMPTIISERLAEHLWPGEDPVGRSMVLWAGQGDPRGEVLGVVGNMRERGIDQGPTFAVYLPYMFGGWPPDIVIHTTTEATAVVPALRAIVGELDADAPLSDIATLEDMVGRSVGSDRFVMLLVTLFAGLALLLALAGVYGVQSYSVALQTPEIGVRVALGASGGQVLRRTIAQAMRPALVGVALGLVGAWALSRFMTTMLFQVEATDPATYGSVAGLLTVAALLSAWLPAWRASRVDPVIAFRAE